MRNKFRAGEPFLEVLHLQCAWPVVSRMITLTHKPNPNILSYFRRRSGADVVAQLAGPNPVAPDPGHALDRACASSLSNPRWCCTQYLGLTGHLVSGWWHVLA